MNFSYAVQWWTYTVIAVGGWVFLVRREVQDAAQKSEPAEPTPFLPPLEQGTELPGMQSPPRKPVKARANSVL